MAHSLIIVQTAEKRFFLETFHIKKCPLLKTYRYNTEPYLFQLYNR